MADDGKIQLTHATTEASPFCRIQNMAFGSVYGDDITIRLNFKNLYNEPGGREIKLKYCAISYGANPPSAFYFNPGSLPVDIYYNETYVFDYATAVYTNPLCYLTGTGIYSIRIYYSYYDGGWQDADFSVDGSITITEEQLTPTLVDMVPSTLQQGEQFLANITMQLVMQPTGGGYEPGITNISAVQIKEGITVLKNNNITPPFNMWNYVSHTANDYIGSIAEINTSGLSVGSHNIAALFVTSILTPHNKTISASLGSTIKELNVTINTHIGAALMFSPSPIRRRNTLSVQGSITTAIGTKELNKVEYYDGATLIKTVSGLTYNITPATPYVINETYDTTPMTEGTHNIKIIAYYKVGITDYTYTSPTFGIVVLEPIYLSANNPSIAMTVTPKPAKTTDTVVFTITLTANGGTTNLNKVRLLSDISGELKKWEYSPVYPTVPPTTVLTYSTTLTSSMHKFTVYVYHDDIYREELTAALIVGEDAKLIRYVQESLCTFLKTQFSIPIAPQYPHIKDVIPCMVVKVSSVGRTEYSGGYVFDSTKKITLRPFRITITPFVKKVTETADIYDTKSEDDLLDWYLDQLNMIFTKGRHLLTNKYIQDMVVSSINPDTMWYEELYAYSKSISIDLNYAQFFT